MPVFLTVEMIMRLLGFGGPSTSSPSVTEYNMFGFSLNEIGTGPVGLAVAALVIILPLICVGCCMKNCCCVCSCFRKLFSCCKRSKNNENPDMADKKTGWRRCFIFPCTKKTPSPPTLPVLMKDVDTYEPVYGGSMYSSGTIYSDPGSTRGGRTSRSSRSGRSRRNLPALPEDSSTYSSTPQITELTASDTGSTTSMIGNHPVAPEEEYKTMEPKKDIFKIPTRPRIL